MSENNAPSIAEAPAGNRRARVFLGVFAGALLIGIAGAWHFAAAGLTLSHYDARAHLVVARRIVDSLTPGWRQLGGVWLPLPHLLNVLPAQWDWAFRTGAVGVGFSIAALAWGLAAFATRLYSRTGSLVAALTPPILILANPNVLYLQSTPMTEPLLIGLALVTVAALDQWMEDSTDAALRRAAWLLGALVMVRYEGWLIAGGLVVVVAVGVSHHRYRTLLKLVSPAGTVLVGFLVLSWASTGRWLLSMDFFTPDPQALHQPAKAASLVVTGVLDLSNRPLVLAAGIGALVCLAAARKQLFTLLPLTLLLAGILPIGAFAAGHPFRIRYMVPLIAGCGVLAGVALTAVPRRLRAPAAAALLVAGLWTSPPTDPTAPMVVEAQWGTPLRLERQHLIDAIRGLYDGSPILASMGSGRVSLMHEASSIGLNISNFLHEGNGDLWLEALRSPKRSVRWVLIEERAEGGDMLAARARTDPEFLAGFRRVAEGGGLALYRRIE